MKPQTKEKLIIWSVGLGSAVVLGGGLYLLRSENNKLLIDASIFASLVAVSMGSAYAASRVKEENPYANAPTTTPTTIPTVTEEPETRDLNSPVMTARTIRELGKLHPLARPKFRAFVSEVLRTYPDHKFELLFGMRTWAEQNEFYAQGRTKPGQIVTWVRGGDSDHNYGFAGDMYFSNPDANKKSNEKLAVQRYTQYAAIAKKHGLLWGGNWNKIDPPHIYLGVGLTKAQMKQRYLAGNTFTDTNGLKYVNV